ncbi:flagellar biosynthesis anti-sigma factor FlgM [Bacillus kwashiorkori]|uniref:flagellar biosynthesis anti-sigma factor FlgM n=1 Tax=Bacillus kwashiorkori TaxID=1522318 RepID=UPI0007856613|nr:flagellar biosynthesis anti-sigma factor FlgM [Bacillus kwashiorkori]
MKITNFGPNGINPYKKPLVKTDSNIGKRDSKSDQIEISEEALKLQQQAQTDPARQAKIAEIKQQIETGTYRVDHQQLAKSIHQYYKDK